MCINRPICAGNVNWGSVLCVTFQRFLIDVFKAVKICSGNAVRPSKTLDVYTRLGRDAKQFKIAERLDEIYDFAELS